MNKERILKNIAVKDSGCWEWQKSLTSAGYGQLTEKKKYWTAHRYSFTAFNHDIPKDKIVRHMCHNTKCCNPAHLELGTHKENYFDSIDKHNESSVKNRAVWSVNGVIYNTIRSAQKSLGLSSSSLCKYTKDGIFDIQAYRDGCRAANKVPKV